MRMILVVITLLLVLATVAACTGTGAAPQNDLLPQPVKDALLANEFSAENHRNVEIEVTGEATVLTYEKELGIEKALCLHIRYEKKLAADQWAAGANSRVIQQKGDEWIINDGLLAVERAWSQHSCLGSYELVVPQ